MTRGRGIRFHTELMRREAQKPELAADFDGVIGRISGDTPVECAVCKSPGFRTLFEATDRLYRTTDRKFRIVECKQCRLIRLFPQPGAGELRGYYPDTYWFGPEEGTVD